MFYEAWGLLLERADQVLRLEVREHVEDPAAQAQLDAVAAMLGDLGAIWPQLFDGLARETACYAAVTAAGTTGRASTAEPLAAHREAVEALSERIEQIRTLPPAEREPANAAVRGAILQAATAQCEIMEAAAAQTADRPVRRI